MPRLMPTDEVDIFSIPGPGNFQFSGTRPEKLGASEYTLVTIVCDVTGSVHAFADLLLKMIKTAIGSCKKSPRAENILVRLILFNTRVMEVHGFIKLDSINVDDYDPLRPTGGTALYDATYSGIGATIKYSEDLITQKFDVNGIVFIITDGDDNASNSTPNMIKEQVAKAKNDEVIDSLTTLLIGIFDKSDPQKDFFKKRLSEFKDNAELDQYIHAGDADEKTLARLANFISQSVSSTSQSLATGTPSQPLTF